MNGQAQPTSRLPLREIQKVFLGTIASPLAEDRVSDQENAIDADVGATANLLITPSTTMSAQERLQIYHRQYWYRLLDCLYDDFPGLRTVVGEKRFRALSVAYLQQYPSKSFSLRDLGCNLATFLADQPHWLGRSRRLGLEMTQFEWAQIVAFDGQALPALSPGQVVHNDGRGPRLALQPYVTLLELNYELDDFSIALRTTEHSRSEAVSSARTRSEVTPAKFVLPRRKRTYLVVHRYQSSVYYKRLSRPAFQLLAKLQQGIDLPDACAEALSTVPAYAQNPEKAAREVQKWFSEWSMLGWFASASNE